MTAVFAVMPERCADYRVRTSTVDGSVVKQSGPDDDGYGYIQAVPNPGYEFLYWADTYTGNPRLVKLDGSGNIPSSVATTAVFTRTIHYCWDPTHYDPVVSSAGGKISVTGPDADGQYTITAVNYNGYTFTGWSDGVETATRYFTFTEDDLLLTDISFRANFTKTYANCYDNTMYDHIVSSAGGYITVSDPDENGVFTLTAVPDEGFTFLNWDDDFTLGATRTVYISDPDMNDILYVARFGKTEPYCWDYSHYEYVVSQAGGTITVEPEEENYRYKITATNQYGYEFTEWADDHSTDPVRYVTFTDAMLDENEVSLTALFEKIDKNCWDWSNYEYVVKQAGGNITVTADAENNRYILTATNQYGYEFTGWQDNGSTDPVRYLTLTGDNLDEDEFQLTALFKKIDQNCWDWSNYEYVVKQAGGNIIITADGENNRYILTASGLYGYEFTEWQDNGSTDPVRYLTLTDGALDEDEFVLTALFEKEDRNCWDWTNYEFVVKQAGGDIVVESDYENNRFKLTARNWHNYEFRYWDDLGDNGGADSIRYLEIVGDDLDLDEFVFTARFEKNLSECWNCGTYDCLTDTEHGSVSVDIDPLDECSRILTVTPDAGYTFFRWEDDEDGNFSNPRVVSIDLENTEQTYTALFLPTTDTEITAWSASSIQVNTEALNLGGSTATIYTTDGTVLASGAVTTIDYGVFSVPAGATDLSTHAGDTLRIVYFCEAGTRPLWQTDAVVPVIVSGTKAVSELSLPDNIATTDIHVLNGAKLTFDEDLTFAALDIYAGGKAVVPSGKTINASSVTMRGDGIADQFPQLVVNGSLNNANSDTIYYDYTLDYHAYYPLAVPYAVDHNAIRTRFGRTASFEIGEYDGATRATGASGWGGVFDDTQNDIPASEGFTVFAVPRKWNGLRPAQTVVRFPMHAALNEGEPQKAAVNVRAYGDENTSDNDRNWNFIGNPYLADFTNLGNDIMSDEGLNVSVGMFEKVLENGVWNGQWQYTGDLRYVTIPSNGFTEYVQEPVTTALLRSFNSFFVQSATDGYLSFELGHRAQNAPQRNGTAQQQPAEELSAGITLRQGNSIDHAGLLIGNDFTYRYDYNADLAKLFGNNQRLSVYMLCNDDVHNPMTQVPHAYLALPATSQNEIYSSIDADDPVYEQIIPLGYRDAASEDMTFDYDAMRYNALSEHSSNAIKTGDKARIVAMLLRDNLTGVVTDLLIKSYTCRAVANTDDSRFTLIVRYVYPDATGQYDVATDISNTTPSLNGNEQEAGNANVYDVLGRRITNGADAVNLPTGVYIVVEQGDVRKEIVQ